MILRAAQNENRLSKRAASSSACFIPEEKEGEHLVK